MEKSENNTCCAPRQKCHRVIWVVIILLISLCLIWRLAARAELQPQAELYQVVLLSNDQAFFGKLHNAATRAPYLTDVYYLKPNTQGATDANGRLLNTNESYNVIKRGNEIHSPTDILYLNPKNILYWENVGADSLVMKGIKTEKEYRASGKIPPGITLTEPPAAAPTAPVSPVK